MTRLATLLLALLLTFPARAQDALEITPVDGGLQFHLAGHLVRIPVPVWTIATAEPVAQARATFNRIEPGVESLLLFPPNESVVTWTTLMGVLAVNRPGYTVDAHYASMIQPMQQSCAAGQLVMSWIAGDAPDVRDGLLLACGRYRPTADATRQCSGGIILAVVVGNADGAAKIYDEWCTGAFDVTDRDSWPVPEAGLLQAAARLKQLSSYQSLR